MDDKEKEKFGVIIDKQNQSESEQPKVEEKSPEDYIELQKTTSVAVNQFIDGEVRWRKKEKLS